MIDIRPCDVLFCDKKRAKKDRYCGMHRVRWNRHKSFDNPVRFKKYSNESNSICLIHGKLTKQDISIKIRKNESNNIEKKDETTDQYLCKKCTANRSLRWRLNRSESYKICYKKSSEKRRLSGKIRESYLRKYRISSEDYKKMFENQNGKCAICKNTEIRKNRNGEIKLLCIDHDHETGKVRDLLCHNCNTAFGMLKESIEIFEYAIEYKRRHSS